MNTKSAMQETAMKPILFSTPMVQAILEGRKTQTRRVVKFQPGEGEYYEKLGVNDWAYISYGGMSGPYTCPYGKEGDFLWVRETFTYGGLLNEYEQIENEKYYYRADSDWAETEWHHDNKGGPQYQPQWKPSIHMPFKACRLFLKITSVSIERLQDISEADAKNEGCKTAALPDLGNTWKTYKQGFEYLWQSINGEESWSDNPFVWVISFEQIEKPNTNL